MATELLLLEDWTEKTPEKIGDYDDYVADYSLASHVSLIAPPWMLLKPKPSGAIAWFVRGNWLGGYMTSKL